jgi:YebC/PmpR family DNA-binding regulatory protein
MAGHSKWANIKFRKERADAKRGKIFSRIAKEIISAVKLGGADPQGNPRLRAVLQKAKVNNVSNDVIERNIKKASSSDQADFTELTYELYGHGGIGIVVEVMTDNKNRTASDMRIATNKKGGNIATPGAVLYNFDQKGIIQVAKGNILEDDLFLAASEAGAEDFELAGDKYLITTNPQELFQVKEILAEKKYLVEEAALEMVPKSNVEVDEEAAKANFELIEWLENLDDVDAVYHNMNLPDD